MAALLSVELSRPPGEARTGKAVVRLRIADDCVVVDRDSTPPERVEGVVAYIRRAIMLALACLAVGMAGDAVAASGVSRAGGRQGLAATPYMGWNTYYGVGGVFDQRTIISVARALLQRRLAHAGYRIVWLDFGWASGNRDQTGELIADRTQWPNGLRWLTGWLHARGLLAGIYTDAGSSGCSHRGVGSLGHYQQDADTFAAWGFDAVKVDFCGAGQEGLSPRPLYRQFARALRNNSSRRPMLLNVCNFWVPGQIDGQRPSLADSSYSNALWAPKIAQSWRTDTDIGFTGNVVFQNVLRNLDRDAAHPKRARTGHWNDPDYLAPELGMTRAEAQAQMTMWAVVAAPLILGSDPRKLSPATIKMLTNKQVIAVDQDHLGIQGTPVREQGSGQIWVKPLAGGARAVALLNRGSTELQITTTPRSIGIAHARRYQIENLWTHATVTTAGEIRARLAPHAAALYRVTAL
jgi:alpha-galactosidase